MTTFLFIFALMALMASFGEQRVPGLVLYLLASVGFAALAVFA